MLPTFDRSTQFFDTASEARWAVEPESLLIARAKTGDPEAISALYERYADGVT